MVAAPAVGGVLLAVMIAAMCVVLGFQVGALVLAAAAGTTLRSG
jgi:hypothetical protein